MNFFRCLTTNEHDRWTASQLLDHGFLKMTLGRAPVVRFLEPAKKASTDGVCFFLLFIEGIFNHCIFFISISFIFRKTK